MAPLFRDFLRFSGFPRFLEFSKFPSKFFGFSRIFWIFQILVFSRFSGLSCIFQIFQISSTFNGFSRNFRIFWIYSRLPRKRLRPQLLRLNGGLVATITTTPTTTTIAAQRRLVSDKRGNGYDHDCCGSTTAAGCKFTQQQRCLLTRLAI